ncbi:MAG: hypothetical protein GC162_17035 [Planctomycetes bacterium]|nr:hypothetical protein [Planctomycetota bacterium]
MTLKYFDSGSGGPDDCLGRWLDDELLEGIRAFRGQFGFFDISALRKYLPMLQGMVDDGGTFRLVIGANNGDPASTADVNALLPIISGNGDARLAIVGFSNALFHPKTLHIVRANDSSVGVVGSANMTAKGLGHNVEAGVVIESSDANDVALRHIATAIDYWFECDEPGVYEITEEDDIGRLETLGLIVPPSTRRRLRGANRARGPVSGRGQRRVGWRPPHVPADEEPAEVEGDGSVEINGEDMAYRPAIVAHWCKELATSDAQQPSASHRTVRRPRNRPTRVTGQLRLTKSVFDIDASRYFRDEFFANEDWSVDIRAGKRWEQANIVFHLLGLEGLSTPQTLLVEYASHRADHAGEPTTVLKWGPALNQWLRDNNHTEYWIVLEKDINGRYWMSFQSDKPGWAP